MIFYNHWAPLCGSYIFQGSQVDKPERQSSSQLIGLRIPNPTQIIESSPCVLKAVSQIYSVCQCYHLGGIHLPHDMTENGEVGCMETSGGVLYRKSRN